MNQQGKLMLTLKAIFVVMLVASASIVLASAFFSSYFEPFTWNPSSSASDISSTYNPLPNYTLTVTSGNCAVNVIPTTDNGLRATLNVNTSFFLKAFAKIDVTAVNNTYEIQLETPQYWGANAVANVYIPSTITSNALTISLQNGAITSDVPNVVKVLSVETTNGQINVMGQNVLNINTQDTNGNTYISVNSFAAITSSAVNGNVQLTAAGATTNGSISLSTTNGNVNYYANPGSNLSISATTVNGAVSISGITCDSSVSNIRQLVGTVNGGGTSVVLATVNGNVKIGSSLAVM